MIEQDDHRRTSRTIKVVRAMVHISFAAVAMVPCLAHAFVPPAVFPRSVARPMRLAMSSQECTSEVINACIQDR